MQLAHPLKKRSPHVFLKFIHLSMNMHNGLFPIQVTHKQITSPDQKETKLPGRSVISVLCELWLPWLIHGETHYPCFIFLNYPRVLPLIATWYTNDILQYSEWKTILNSTAVWLFTKSHIFFSDRSYVYLFQYAKSEMTYEILLYLYISSQGLLSF